MSKNAKQIIYTYQECLQAKINHNTECHFDEISSNNEMLQKSEIFGRNFYESETKKIAIKIL